MPCISAIPCLHTCAVPRTATAAEERGHCQRAGVEQGCGQAYKERKQEKSKRGQQQQGGQ